VFIVADSHTAASQTMKPIGNQVPHSPDRYVSRQGATGYLTKSLEAKPDKEPPWRYLMIGAIHSAFSGLTAFSRQIEVTAHNVANVNTDGFKKSHMEFVSVETGGVLPVVQKDDSTGPTVLRDSGYGPIQVELSNVDFGEEAVNQIIGQRGFEANLQAINTADQMLGTILDIKK
jgi:flagellar basal-body rod protein FlgC